MGRRKGELCAGPDFRMVTAGQPAERKKAMKYSEAIKIALKDPVVRPVIDSFRRGILKYADPGKAHTWSCGSVQFAIGDECFYYGGEAIWDEVTGLVCDIKFRGGKHTVRRSRQLLDRGETIVIGEA